MRVSRPRRFFLFFCVAHAILAALLAVPGYLAIDEVIYHWMALDAPQPGGLAVETYYSEFPSPEYTHNFLPVHRGRTAPQYPYLTGFLAAPLVRAFGFTGLILLNFVAFPLLLGLTWKLARLLFASERIAGLACGLLVFGGYAWEYSLAAWPQVVSVLLGAASLYFCARALSAADRRARLRWAGLAGLVAGLSLGIRIDNGTLLVALLLVFLFACPWRPREAAALALGCLPGLSLLALTNSWKFGTWSPFSYGPDNRTKVSSLPAPLLGALGLGTVVLWVLTRRRAWFWTRRHVRTLAGGAVLLLALPLSVPSTRATMAKFSGNLNSKYIDASSLDRAYEGAGLRRAPGGGLVYLESLKKAWLQQMPWLAVLVVPVLALGSGGVRRRLLDVSGALSATGGAGGAKATVDPTARRGPSAPDRAEPARVAGTGERPNTPHSPSEGSGLSKPRTERTPAPVLSALAPLASIALLLLPVLTLVALMALAKFHGGLALNQRYLLPSLPFVSLLGAWTLDRLVLAGMRWPRPVWAGSLAVLILGSLLFLVWRVVPRADQQDLLLMRWPLLLAALVALGSLLVVFARGRARSLAGRGLGVVLVAAVAWSFAVSFLYDLPRHRRQRISNLEVARVVKALIPPGAAFFSAPYLDPFYALVEVPEVRLLFPDRDQFRDFPALVDFHLQAGRPVYGVFRFSDWQRLMKGVLAGKESTPVYTFRERYDRGPVLVPLGPGMVLPVNTHTSFVLARIETGK